MEHFQNPSELRKHILDAGHEVELKTVDINGETQLGLGIPQATTKHGKRNSVAESYLKPVLKRKNVDIQPLSQVVQILISPHTKEAYGVKYLHEGKLHVAKATKEIILSAGVIESPKLLILSGTILQCHIISTFEFPKQLFPLYNGLKVNNYIDDLNK